VLTLRDRRLQVDAYITNGTNLYRVLSVDTAGAFSSTRWRVKVEDCYTCVVKFLTGNEVGQFRLVREAPKVAAA